MTAENWKYIEYTCIAISGIMTVFDLLEKKKPKNIYKGIIAIFLVVAFIASLRETSIISEEHRITKIQDSLQYVKNCEKAENETVNLFNSQRDFISGQLTQLGFKVDAVSNRIVKLNQSVVPDSILRSISSDNLKIKEQLKHTLSTD